MVTCWRTPATRPCLGAQGLAVGAAEEGERAAAKVTEVARIECQ